jgi:hypothetical protein
MSHIVPLITDAVRDHLETQMLTVVHENDQLRANHVEVGRFQDNPTKMTVYIAVSGGDPEDPDFKDGIVSLEEFPNVGITYFSGEIGGGSAWWRRGNVQFGCYFKGETQDSARTLSYEVLGRICQHLGTVTVTDLEDDYGEQAIRMHLFANSMFESGGPGSYIWRGKVLWQCLTERS